MSVDMSVDVAKPVRLGRQHRLAAIVRTSLARFQLWRGIDGSVADNRNAQYAFALFTVIAASLASSLIATLVGHFMNFPFYAAVAASAWFGTRAGCVSLFLSILVVGDVCTPPLFDLHVDPNELPSFVAFVLFAVTCLAWSSQHGFTHRQLEATVRERTSELRRTNAALQVQIAEREAADKQRRRTERALRDAEVELARALRLATVAEIAAAIAHEINQPLGAIATNGAACSRAISQHPPMLDLARDATACIIADAHRAGDVILRIRGLFNKERPKWMLLNVDEVVQQVIKMSRGAADRSGAIVITEFSASPALVMGDPIQVQQVLLNLVTNALDSMAEIDNRPRLLTIRTDIVAAEVVKVTVEDTGHGIDAEQIPIIFAGFYTTKPSGIGIGLSISRSIAEAHGGSLSVLPSNCGARFTFTLPLARMPSSISKTARGDVTRGKKYTEKGAVPGSRET
jgi:signal transduction histidine kinase